MSFIRYFITFLLLSPLFMNKAWAADDRLVAIFCAGWQQRTDWRALAARLEAREPVTDAKLMATPEFQACASTHAEEFALGEFLWKGREHVRQSRRAHRPGARKPVTWAGTDFQLPYVGTVRLAAEKTDAGSEDPYGFVQRERHYGEAWESFLASIKGRYRPSATARQVARNTD